jgi:hypothetical protein
MTHGDRIAGVPLLVCNIGDTDVRFRVGCSRYVA